MSNLISSVSHLAESYIFMCYSYFESLWLVSKLGQKCEARCRSCAESIGGRGGGGVGGLGGVQQDSSLSSECSQAVLHC